MAGEEFVGEGEIGGGVGGKDGGAAGDFSVGLLAEGGVRRGEIAGSPPEGFVGGEVGGGEQGVR